VAGLPVQWTIDGADQSERFLQDSRRVMPTRGGLFIVILDRQGEIIGRHFLPPERFDQEALIDQLLRRGHEGLMLLAWSPPEHVENSQSLPFGLTDLPAQPAAWLLADGQLQALPEAATSSTGEWVEFKFAPATCALLQEMK
jgi:hypothetical protein